jgi:hypothetical protein
MLLLLVGIPLLVFSLFFGLGQESSWLPDSQFKEIFVGWVTPLCFSLCWVYIIMVFKTDMVDVLEMMDTTGSVIPTRMKFFFSLNALLILCLFIIPIISPVITILTFSSLIWKATTSKKEMAQGESIGMLWKIIIVLVSIVPLIAAIFVLPGIIKIAGSFWNDNWVTNLEAINNINMAIATSMTISDFYMISSIMRTGPQDYHYLESDNEEGSPYAFSKRIIQLVFFALMLYLWYIDHPFFRYLTWIGLILVGLIWLLTTAMNANNRNFNISNNILGYALLGIFLVANLIAFPLTRVNVIIQNVALILSGLIYLFIFFYALFNLDDIKRG